VQELEQQTPVGKEGKMGGAGSDHRGDSQHRSAISTAWTCADGSARGVLRSENALEHLSSFAPKAGAQRIGDFRKLGGPVRLRIATANDPREISRRSAEPQGSRFMSLLKIVQTIISG
jgi:hypothetical protein